MVGLNLCPFARPLLQGPGLRIAVCAADDSEPGRQRMQEKIPQANIARLNAMGRAELAARLAGLQKL